MINNENKQQKITFEIAKVAAESICDSIKADETEKFVDNVNFVFWLCKSEVDEFSVEDLKQYDDEEDDSLYRDIRLLIDYFDLQALTILTCKQQTFENAKIAAMKICDSIIADETKRFMEDINFVYYKNEFDDLPLEEIQKFDNTSLYTEIRTLQAYFEEEKQEKSNLCHSCSIELDLYRDGTQEKDMRCHNCFWEQESSRMRDKDTLPLIEPDYRPK